jgi:hypothetical protein
VQDVCAAGAVYVDDMESSARCGCIGEHLLETWKSSVRLNIIQTDVHVYGCFVLCCDFKHLKDFDTSPN